jgi:hypothetical protein
VALGVGQHNPGVTPWLKLGPTCTESDHFRGGLLQVGDGEVQVRVLGRVGPAWRRVTLDLLEAELDRAVTQVDVGDPGCQRGPDMIGSSPAFGAVTVSRSGSRPVQCSPDSIAHCGHVFLWRRFTLTEHRHLQRGSVGAKAVRAFSRGGLDNEVDTYWRGVRVRPQAGIHLFGFEYLAHGYGHTTKQSAASSGLPQPA